MSRAFSSAAARREAARAAVQAAEDAERVRLRVRCAENHHVAVVYDTPLGLVCVSRTGPRAHGSKDFVAGHHGAQRGRNMTDLVDPGPEAMADDELPAGCACGPRTLSRRELLAAIAAGERKVLVT